MLLVVTLNIGLSKPRTFCNFFKEIFIKLFNQIEYVNIFEFFIYAELINI